MTAWTVILQAPLSVGFSRREYWSGLPFPSPGDLPSPGIEPGLPHWEQSFYCLSHEGSPLDHQGNPLVSIAWSVSLYICLSAYWLFLLFSCSVVSDSLQHRGLQHTSFPVFHHLPEFAQTHVHRVGDAIHHLVLCHPLLPSLFPSTRVFSSESALCIRWPVCWSFSLSISPSDEYSELISFRMDWLDPCSPRDSQESSLAPQFQSINSLAVSYHAMLCCPSAYSYTHQIQDASNWSHYTHHTCSSAWVVPSAFQLPEPVTWESS